MLGHDIPMLAESELAVSAYSAALTYVLAFGVRAAVGAVAALTVGSRLVVAVRMHERLAARRRVA